jgi:hypothetical protein
MIAVTPASGDRNECARAAPASVNGGFCAGCAAFSACLTSRTTVGGADTGWRTGPAPKRNAVPNETMSARMTSRVQVVGGVVQNAGSSVSISNTGEVVLAVRLMDFADDDGAA